LLHKRLLQYLENALKKPDLKMGPETAMVSQLVKDIELLANLMEAQYNEVVVIQNFIRYCLQLIEPR